MNKITKCRAKKFSYFSSLTFDGDNFHWKWTVNTSICINCSCKLLKFDSSWQTHTFISCSNVNYQFITLLQQTFTDEQSFCWFNFLLFSSLNSLHWTSTFNHSITNLFQLQTSAGNINCKESSSVTFFFLNYSPSTSVHCFL